MLIIPNWAGFYTLLHNFGYNTGANGTAAFTDGETETFFDSDGGDEGAVHLDVVARHTHFNAFRKGYDAGYVGCPEVELRTVAVKERSVAAAFFFGQYVYFGFIVGVGFDGAGLGQYLAALDFFAVYAAEQGADVVAGYCLVEEFAEHFYAGYDGGFRFFGHADDFNGFADFDDATLDTAGGYGTATGDGEDVFYRHEEGFVGSPFRGGDVGVNSVHEFMDFAAPLAFPLGAAAFEGFEG